VPGGAPLPNGASLARWAYKTRAEREDLSAALWALAVEAGAAGQRDRELTLTKAAAALCGPETWPMVEAMANIARIEAEIEALRPAVLAAEQKRGASSCACCAKPGEPPSGWIWTRNAFAVCSEKCREAWEGS
jgi:hypothetical protein